MISVICIWVSVMIIQATEKYSTEVDAAQDWRDKIYSLRSFPKKTSLSLFAELSSQSKREFLTKANLKHCTAWRGQATDQD